MFIGHGVGPMAIAGLAVTFPFMNLAAAFGSLVGVGASTLVSVKMGQKDYKSAVAILGNVLILNGIIGILFMTGCLIFLDSILIFFGASNETLPYARDYMTIILYGNLITHLYFGLNDVVRASGYPQRAMLATLSAVCINGVFNAIFIFGMDMGIRGAALGTICAQFLALLIILRHFFNPKSFIHFQKGMFNVRIRVILSMLAIGLSPFLMNVCSCLVVMLVNTGLKKYGGDMYIGAYGIVNRIVFLFIMTVMGFNQGMQPIVGYNYGAQQLERMLKALKYTIFCGISVTTLGFITCQFFPTTIIRFFTTDIELIGLAEHGMKIMSIMLPVVGFQMVSTTFFQSIGMASKSIFLSLTRQLIFLVPCLFILPTMWGTDGIWGSFPIADALATLTTGFMLGWQLRKFKKNRMKDTVVLQ
jgi:putative MATE family efflux protein